MAESSDKGLETLQIWQKALGFAVKICKQIINKFPEEEKWCLAVQLRRSAQSIPANIAEGYGRYHYLEGVHFCYIARGSLEETYSHLTFAHKMEYLPDDLYQQISGEVTELRRMINGYISFLKERKRGADDLPSIHILREIPFPYMAETEPGSDSPDS